MALNEFERVITNALFSLLWKFLKTGGDENSAIVFQSYFKDGEGFILRINENVDIEVIWHDEIILTVGGILDHFAERVDLVARCIQMRIEGTK